MARGGTLSAAPPGVGFAAAGALTIPPPTPLIDTPGPFTVPPAALTEWAADAEEGARCVYARVETISLHPRLLAKAQQLAGQGVVLLKPNRRFEAGSSLFDYVLQRTYAPLVSLSPPAAPERDAAMEIIFERLKADARLARRASSDLELAQAANLPTRHAAAWRVRKLETLTRISVETVPWRQGPWRIVRIGALATAAPPGWPA